MDFAGLLGPFYLGAVFEFFFLGVLSSQITTYRSNYPKDPIHIKFLVASCSILCIFRAAQRFYLTWGGYIRDFGTGNLEIFTQWPVYTEPVSMAVLSIAAQSYFVWRCFNLTRQSWVLLIFLWTIILSVLGMSVHLSIQFAHHPGYSPEKYLHLVIPMVSLGLVVDVVITSIVLVRLLQSRKGINKTTDAFLLNWVSITLQCALPPALSQAANLAAFVLSGNRDVWHVLFNSLTPLLYVFSLMYTLNARRDSPSPSATSNRANNALEGNHQDEPLGERRGFERTGVITLSTFQAGKQVLSRDTRQSYSSHSELEDSREELSLRHSLKAPDSIPQ